MTDQHPITPPPGLVLQWLGGAPKDGELGISKHIATQAARWGADQELEACCEWLVANSWKTLDSRLRVARRPKPLSLKEQALLQLDTLNADLAMHGMGCDLSQIRRALEALPND